MKFYNTINLTLMNTKDYDNAYKKKFNHIINQLWADHPDTPWAVRYLQQAIAYTTYWIEKIQEADSITAQNKVRKELIQRDPFNVVAKIKEIQKKTRDPN